MSNSPVWGILSTANIGRKAVIPAIQRISGATVLAIASRDAAKAKEAALAHGIPRHYGSYEDLLADPEVTAVYNPLPNSLHLPWTLAALRAGKHVLCEKPLGVSAAECREMAEAALRAGRVLMEAFMYRFHARSEATLELVRRGDLGRLSLIRARFAFTVTNPANIRLSRDLGGGALMDVGCYCVNAARTLAGAQPTEAQAYATWAASGVDSALSGTLRFPGNLTAQLDCALDQPRYEGLQVFGSEGWLEVASAFLPGTEDAALSVTTRKGGQKTLVFPGHDQYQRMVEHFHACVLQGTPPRYDAREAADNLAVVEALLASARQGGRAVSL
jgi:D-xylose 1-dehydrogenase (NADP+, D-xylono-1,5-lactone-forming)